MKKYSKIILYYFTGTGNALTAGRWICQEAEKKKIATHLIPIDNNTTKSPVEIDDKTLIGFLSPTHGFSIAPAMLKFILKFPGGSKADVFILNTRAGLKLGKIFIPGLSGAAQFLPMIILRLKGYKIMGGLPLDMPSNWLFFHSGLKQTKVESIVRRCEDITRNFITKLLNDKKDLKKMLVTLPVDIALLPISIVYYIYARFILAKIMIYTSNCNNCKICENHCPVKAIKIVHDRPYWTFSCEGCMRCINLCPRESIQCSHLIFLIILIIPGILFNNLLLKYIGLPDFLTHHLIQSALKMVLTLIELFFIYAVIQKFLKYKFFGNFFKYTSLTAYWRKYKAPGLLLKDFKKEP